MRIVVTGSREWPKTEDYQIWDRLDNLLPNIELIGVGDARGVDKYVWGWCRHNGHLVTSQCFPADWDKNGKRAGHIRNKEMLETVKPDLVLAFFVPGYECRGTWNCVETAQDMKIRVEPYRLR